MSDSNKNTTFSNTIYAYKTQNNYLLINQLTLTNKFTDILNSRKSNIANISIPIGFSLAVLPSLITESFDNWFNVSKFTWNAIFMGVFIISFSIILIVLSKWIYYLIKFPKKSAEDYVQEIINNSSIIEKSTLLNTSSAPFMDQDTYSSN